MYQLVGTCGCIELNIRDGSPRSLVTYSRIKMLPMQLHFIPASTHTYRVIGTDVNGCTNTDSLQITEIICPM